MIRVLSFFLTLAPWFGLPQISEVSGNARVACQTQAVNTFTPSQAPRTSDNELLRTILITEDVEQRNAA